MHGTNKDDVTNLGTRLPGFGFGFRDYFVRISKIGLESEINPKQKL